MIRRHQILLSLTAAGFSAMVALGAMGATGAAHAATALGAGAPPAATPSAPIAAGAAPAAAAPAAPAAKATTPAAAAPAVAGFHRVELPGGTADQKFPYDIEVPQSWTLHEIKEQAVIWLGPEGADPDTGSQMVYVRISPAALGNPEDVVANFKKSVPADGSWSAPVAEVREVAGVRGVLVQINSVKDKAVRKTLILKMPLPKTSVDFIASAPGDSFDKMLPDYQRILLSVRPAK
jgi:hypothetical protein